MEGYKEHVDHIRACIPFTHQTRNTLDQDHDASVIHPSFDAFNHPSIYPFIPCLLKDPTMHTNIHCKHGCVRAAGNQLGQDAV